MSLLLIPRCHSLSKMYSEREHFLKKTLLYVISGIYITCIVHIFTVFEILRLDKSISSTNTIDLH